MKKILLASVICSSALLAGCQTPYGSAIIYNDFDAPVDVRDNASNCDKRGEATMVNILNIFSSGNAGVAAAKDNGGITKVSSVDVNFNSLLGIFGKTTTVVCGE